MTRRRRDELRLVLGLPPPLARMDGRRRGALLLFEGPTLLLATLAMMAERRGTFSSIKELPPPRDRMARRRGSAPRHDLGPSPPPARMTRRRRDDLPLAPGAPSPLGTMAGWRHGELPFFERLPIPLATMPSPHALPPLPRACPSQLSHPRDVLYRSALCTSQ